MKAISNNGHFVNPVRKRILESRKLVTDIELFLENFSRENMSHREGMLKIQEDLKRINLGHDFKTFKDKNRDAS